MVASASTSEAIATLSNEHHKNTVPEKLRYKRLESSVRWGIVVTLTNLAYGQLVVANRLTPDRRQDSWLLMHSPAPTCLLSLCYVVGVAHFGPRLMGEREPMSGLRPLMVAYNAFQVVFSAWLLYEIGMGGWFGSYNLMCQPCDFSDDPQAVRMMHATYWYYLSKFIDFLDTVFFVLNKKYEHISPLHVVHHSLMPVNMWYGVRYQPGGHNTFFGFLNSFVHVVMYTYYLLAAMGPRLRPFLWWKKYLTSLQILQFLAVILHSTLHTLPSGDCRGIPPQFGWWICANASLFLSLFARFYLNAYYGGRGGRRRREEKKKVEEEKKKEEKEEEEKRPPPQEKAKPSDIIGAESNGVDKRSSNGVSGNISCVVTRRGMLN